MRDLAQRYGPEVAAEVAKRMAKVVADGHPELLRYLGTLPDYFAKTALHSREMEAWMARQRPSSAATEEGGGEGQPHPRPRRGRAAPAAHPRREPDAPSRPPGRPRSAASDLSEAERRRRERQRAYSAARYEARRLAASRLQGNRQSKIPTAGNHAPNPQGPYD